MDAVPPLVGTRNPPVLGFSEPRRAHAWRRSAGRGLGQTLSTGSSTVGSRVTYRRFCGQHTLLLGRSRMSRTPCHRVRLRPRYAAAMSSLSGANTAPVTVLTGLVVPTKTPHRVFRITVCLPLQPRPLFGVWVLPDELVRQWIRVHA